MIYYWKDIQKRKFKRMISRFRIPSTQRDFLFCCRLLRSSLNLCRKVQKIIFLKYRCVFQKRREKRFEELSDQNWVSRLVPVNPIPEFAPLLDLQVFEKRVTHMQWKNKLAQRAKWRPLKSHLPAMQVAREKKLHRG